MNHLNQSLCTLHPNHISAAIESGLKSKNRKQVRINEYLLNPKYCIQCNNIITYEKRLVNKFCNRSCSKTYQNLHSIMSDDTKLKISNAAKLQNNKVSENYKHQYNLSPRHCKQCNNVITYENRKLYYCSDKCRTLSRQYNAKFVCKLGGNRNRNSFWYESPIAGKVYLESSYELKVAKSLDNNNIKWCRPKCIKYVLNDITKRYFPDFYLIDYNIYLDPKNNFLIQQDELKIKTVMKQNNIHILVLDKNNLDWSDIQNKISFLRISDGAPDL